jgi:hypothetical protein
MRTTRALVMFSLLVFATGCGAETTAATTSTPAVASASRVLSSPTSAVTKATRSTTAVATAVTTARDTVLAGLCATHCAPLTAVSKLPACLAKNDGCAQQVNAAATAFATLSSDIHIQRIDVTGWFPLDDRLTEADDTVSLLDHGPCADPVGENEFLCSIQLITAKLLAANLVSALGGNPN